MMNNFEGFGLSQTLNNSLVRMGHETPTPIQQKAIPLGLKGRDILGSAQTGTGKTAAFSIPLIETLLRKPESSALVLTPTRELAKQVLSVIHELLGRDSGINTAFIIGGEPMGKQFTQLRAKPRIVVGTPGRINDHLERSSLRLNTTDFLVLDETDRMLDMGFGVQLDRIIKFLPKQRQTLMFSATLPKEIVQLSGKYLSNPERVSVGATNVVATNIKQEVIRIEQHDKYKELVVQLHDREGSVIVFAKTKHNADKMARKLREDGFTSEALHGDLRQNKRDKVMKNFREKNFRVLVATDIAARGLDVPHIQHVINYDLPQVAEDYIHRMGRTARAGAAGSAISFVASQDGRKWHAIECLLDPEAAAKKQMPAQGKNKSRRKPYRGRPEGGQKRFEKHGKKPRREDRKFGDKPRGDQERSDRPYGDKPRSDKPRSNKPYGDKPRREDRNDNSQGDKPRSDRPYGNKPRSDKPRSDRPYGDKPRSDKPRSDRPYGDKPRSDNSQGDKPRSNKPRQDKPYGDKFISDKPRKNKSFNGKPQNAKPGKRRFKNKSRPKMAA